MIARRCIRRIGHLASLVSGHEDRLIGLAVINPALADAASDLLEAVESFGLRGAKMVPSGWFPYDDCAHDVYATAARLKVPILFHSGIFIDGRSSRYCRPAFFEAVREHPGLRVTSHISGGHGVTRRMPSALSTSSMVWRRNRTGRTLANIKISRRRKGVARKPQVAVEPRPDGRWAAQ
jgi:predicted TIM-barrel fold metal-dependent hydrolase